MTRQEAPQGAPNDAELRYLKLLAKDFPTRQAAFTEVINLEAILNLPKGTEHFMSDVHGEYEAFEHILNNCSGVIRERVEHLFSDELSATDRADLCTLIYYPKERLRLLIRRGIPDDAWYETNLMLLVRLARTLSGLYTRSKVRRAMPVSYAYIIDELLHASASGETSRHEYHKEIIRSIIRTGAANDFICSLAALVKRLAVDHLHLIGDVFDRGAHADKIMDRLVEYHSLDFQWGNHDICWMGAAAGSEACIASVVRTNVRYHTLEVLESAYGISLRKLALFAERTYRADDVISPMEKAISIILFKVEGQLIKRHPDFDMTTRLLLDEMDLSHGTVHVAGRDLPLSTCDFPTVDAADPYALSTEEQEVMDGLKQAFAQSERLRKHVGFLYEVGSIYLVSNGNLLFHGCIPLEADGTFSTVICEGYPYSGRSFMDFCDRIARRAWMQGDQNALDWMWYLWCGKHSPLSGRVVKTFERSLVDDRSAWEEPQDPYFYATRSSAVCEEILEEFGLSGEHSHIINGHKPVRAIDGESPIKGEGRLLVIDGGFCEAYHKQTGIAGYTLISTAESMRIKAHRPFMGIEAAIEDNADILSESTTIEREEPPLRIRDSDTGVRLMEQIDCLHQLLDAYRTGLVKERVK